MFKIKDSTITLFLGILLTTYSIYYFLNPPIVCQWFLSPYLFPLFIGILTTITSFFIKNNTEKQKINMAKVCAVIVITVAYYLLILSVNYFIATAVYLGVLIYYLGEHSLKKVIPISIITPVILHLVFSVGLRVRLP